MIALIQLLASKAPLLLMMPLFIACTQDIPEPKAKEAISEETPQKFYEIEFYNKQIVNDSLYDLEFGIEQSDDGEYFVVTTIVPRNGAFVASPLSNNNFTGLFTFDLSINRNISVDDEIEENPRSIETIDPYEGVPVNIVREKTTYKRKLHISTTADFDVSSKITFTIEPRCTFEEIPLMIKQRDGVLTIQKWEC